MPVAAESGYERPAVPSDDLLFRIVHQFEANQPAFLALSRLAYLALAEFSQAPDLANLAFVGRVFDLPERFPTALLPYRQLSLTLMRMFNIFTAITAIPQFADRVRLYCWPESWPIFYLKTRAKFEAWMKGHSFESVGHRVMLASQRAENKALPKPRYTGLVDFVVSLMQLHEL